MPGNSLRLLVAAIARIKGPAWTREHLADLDATALDDLPPKNLADIIAAEIVTPDPKKPVAPL